jgi:hypothetical protein
VAIARVFQAVEWRHASTHPVLLSSGERVEGEACCPLAARPVVHDRCGDTQPMKRRELSLLIGMTLAGKQAPPVGDPSWQAIEYANRADVAGRLTFLGRI